MSSGLFPAEGRKTGSWFWEHSLTIVLASTLIGMAAVDFAMTWVMEHTQQPPFLLVWAHDLWESWAAEPLGVILPVILTKWLWERGSSQS